MNTKTKARLLFILRFISALILLQTLFFKFTGAPESKFIFSTMGVEPWGRWFSGFVELIASILLLIPITQAFGALIAVGVMSGAIVSHIFILGIIVQEDNGLLFSLACTVFIFCNIILFLNKDQIFDFIQKIRGLDARSKK